MCLANKNTALWAQFPPGGEHNFHIAPWHLIPHAKQALSSFNATVRTTWEKIGTSVGNPCQYFTTVAFDNSSLLLSSPPPSSATAAKVGHFTSKLPNVALPT